MSDTAISGPAGNGGLAGTAGTAGTVNPQGLKQLGGSNLLVSPLALGGNVFGWTVDEPMAFSLLDAWLDGGMNFIDTADVYSAWVAGHAGGESESMLGRWLQHSGKRARVVLATKVGKRMASGGQGLKPAYIRRAVEDSLRRLRTDYIDLYQSHDDDVDTPLEDTLGAYAELMRAGKIRAIGASNYGAERLNLALQISAVHDLPRYESLQPLYNLYDRAAYEQTLEPVCVHHGLGVMSYYALAAGFLTGKYRTSADAAKSPRGPSTVGKYLNARGLRILAALDAVAAGHAASPGQVALAWQLTRPSITAPIASATTLAQLHELVAATRLALTAAEVALLNDASA
jgi:aryl-alcohol dehydrogenase-like predicted oxidoreductase